MTIINEAREFATRAHRDQFRKYTGESYIVHPEEVAGIVREAGLSDDAVAAAWLHDTVEDCPVTLADIAHHFGQRVTCYVRALTDVPASVGNRAMRRVLDKERIAAASYEPQTIKAADLISNTRSIAEHDPKFARVYLTEKRAVLELLTRAHPDVLARAWSVLRAAEIKVHGPLVQLVED